MFPFKPVVVFEDIYFYSINVIFSELYYIINTDMVLPVVDSRSKGWAIAATMWTEVRGLAHLPVTASVSLRVSVLPLF